MKRLIMLLTVVAVMAGMLVAMAAPALASNTNTYEDHPNGWGNTYFDHPNDFDHPNGTDALLGFRHEHIREEAP